MMNHLEYKRTLTAEQAIDEELVNCHLGTLESFESHWDALSALMMWHQNVGEYFANKKQIYEESECVAVVGNWGKVEWMEGITPQLGAKLFASPSKRDWVGLTDDEVEEVFTFPFHYIPFARAIEAKLKEKNGG